jgi:hypothetical protein
VRVLGLCRVHNGGRTIARTLDSMAAFCDDIYVIDDRSTDDTAAILAGHPVVTNVVTAHPELPDTPWLIPEGSGLELLYRMADFCRPDWVVMIDADQTIEADVDVRALLTKTPPETVALLCPIVSVWDDPDFPEMIPLMGTNEALRGPFWRWRPGLRAGGKPLHNPHWPQDIGTLGEIEHADGVRVIHDGWSSVAERIAKARHYFRLDPDCAANFGVAYDRSLLFGYRLDEIDLLKADYVKRASGDFDAHDARLPIGDQRFAIGRGYGSRAGGFHPGIDFVVDGRTEINAVADGIISETTGNGIVITHGDYEAIYAFRRTTVEGACPGDCVTAGSRIGTLESVTDAHLHFEVRQGGRHINPVRHLANMGLRPWPQPGRLRSVAGGYLPSSDCPIATTD